MKPIFSIFNFLKGLKTTKFHDVPSGTAVKMYGKDADDNFVEDDVPSGGATAFTELSDVPQSYTDQAGKMLIVNEDENALEFTDVPSGGSLPEGTENQTLRHNGESWEATDLIQIDKTPMGTNYKILIGKSGNYGNIDISACNESLVRSEAAYNGDWIELDKIWFKFLDSIFTLYRYYNGYPGTPVANDEIRIQLSPLQKLLIKEKDSEDLNVDNTGKYLKCIDDDGTCEWADVSGGSGGIPSGTHGQTLRYNINGELEATNQIYLTGDNITATTEYQNGDNYTDAGLSGYSSDYGESSCSLYANITNNVSSKDCYIDCSVVSESFANFKATIEIVSEQILIKRTNIDDTGKYLRIKNTNGEVEFVDDVLRTARVELSPEQIRALHTTPIELIPAPGENKMIVIHSTVYYYKYIDEAYTQAGYNNVRVMYDSLLGEVATYDWFQVTNLGTADKISILGTGNILIDKNPTAFINKNIIAAATGAITNDNANGTLTIELTYHIADLS